MVSLCSATRNKYVDQAFYILHEGINGMSKASETAQAPVGVDHQVSELTGSTGFLVNFRSLFRHGKLLGDESEAPNLANITSALHIGQHTR
jgi:hypothetical protein